MSHTRQIWIGALLASPGVIAYVLASSAGPMLALDALYLVAAAGALVLGLGVARWALSGAFAESEAAAAREIRHDRAIVRTLLAVAAADGELKESELNVIENFASKIADITIGDALVRSLFEEMKAQPVSIRDELAGLAADMAETERVTVYQGAALVAHCVMPVGPKERAALDQIAGVLRLTPALIARIEERAHEACADTSVAAAVKYWLGLRPD